MAQTLERARDAIATFLDGETRESPRAAGVDANALIEVVEVDTSLSD